MRDEVCKNSKLQYVFYIFVINYVLKKLTEYINAVASENRFTNRTLMLSFDSQIV